MNKKIIVKTGIEYNPVVFVEDTEESPNENGATISVKTSENFAEWSSVIVVEDENLIKKTSRELEAQLYGIFSNSMQTFLKRGLSEHNNFMNMNDDVFMNSSSNAVPLVPGKIAEKEEAFLASIANKSLEVLKKICVQQEFDYDTAEKEFFCVTNMDSIRVFLGGVNVLKKNNAGEYEFSSEAQRKSLVDGIAIKYANDFLFGLKNASK